MFIKTSLFIGLLAISIASAFPSPIKPRVCSYDYLPQLWTIAQHVPDTPNGPFTSPLHVANDIGKKDLVASFRNISSSAYGCTLELDYQPNHDAVVNAQAGDPTVLNVYRVSDGGNFPYPLTWDNTAPRTGSLVGTFHFPSAAELSVPSVRVVNSFQYDQIMTFRFTIADDAAIGSVMVDENALSGLRIFYSC